MSSHRLLERAFALAENGSCPSIGHIRTVLVREGYSYSECHALSGKSLAQQLNARIKAAYAQRRKRR